MAEVEFTAQLQRHVSAPTTSVDARTVREALERVLAAHPRLRGYVLDEQGRLRQHVAVFLDGELIADRAGLSDPLRPESRLLVMQALSGG